VTEQRPRTFPQKRWPEPVKRRAREIYASEGRSVSRTRDRLRAEDGQDVPLATLERWCILRPEASEAPSVPGLATRLLSLCSSELRRLERLPASKVDLDRATKVAQILKTVDPLTRSVRQAPQRLSDLASDQTEGVEAPPEETATLTDA
jgi:hypothetical protein